MSVCVVLDGDSDEETDKLLAKRNTGSRALPVDSSVTSQVSAKWSPLLRVSPLKPSVIEYLAPYRPNLPFLISDIRALWRSGLSARVPECQKLKTVG